MRSGPSQAPRTGDTPTKRSCMWCDSTDHERRDCESYKDALAKRLIFWKDGKLCATETGMPFATNFGKGGMKKLLEDFMARSSHIARDGSRDASAYGVKIERKPEGEVREL